MTGIEVTLMVANTVESVLSFLFFGWFFGQRWYHRSDPDRHSFCAWMPRPRPRDRAERSDDG